MKKNNLLLQMIVAFLLAVILGIIFGPQIEVVQPLGDLFLRLIQFIMIPLVIATLVVGVASTGNIRELGELGGKTIAYFLLTTFAAVVIGLSTAYLISPGLGVDLEADVLAEEVEVTETEGLVETLLSIIPTNPIASMTEGDILQVVFFAVFLGIGITLVGEKAEPVKNFFDGFAEVMYKITGIVVRLAPLGVFGLIAPIVGSHGLSILMPLINLILAMAIACAVQVGLIYSILVYRFGRLNPITFFKAISEAAVIAFSTTSSSGTLPVTMKNVEENLGVTKKVSGFVLPVGATINMDGAAIYHGVAVIFIAQLYGVDLSFFQLTTVVITATLASIGSAGIPGAALVILTMVLTSVGLPLEGIALIAGVDRILDMFRTSTNVIGDASASVVISGKDREAPGRETSRPVEST